MARTKRVTPRIGKEYEITPARKGEPARRFKVNKILTTTNGTTLTGFFWLPDKNRYSREEALCDARSVVGLWEERAEKRVAWAASEKLAEAQAAFEAEAQRLICERLGLPNTKPWPNNNGPGVRRAFSDSKMIVNEVPLFTLANVLGIRLPPLPGRLECSHSACAQNYIDTGSTACVEGSVTTHLAS